MCAICMFSSSHLAQTYTLLSPDQRNKVVVEVKDDIRYSIVHNGVEIISPSPIGMNVHNDIALGDHPAVRKTDQRALNEKIYPVVRQKSKLIVDACNELTIEFQQPFALVFRAYNDGVAYRFQTAIKGDMKVNAEKVSFNFPADYYVYFPEEEKMFSHNERTYKHVLLSEINQNRFCSTPALLEVTNGPKILITESDLDDYPGLWLTGHPTQKNALAGMFAHHPVKVEKKTDRDVPVTEYADYLAATKGTRSFPWRLMIIADKDVQLMESQLVYQLAKSSQLKDTKWIKPGKVAWDWWNALNIYGVDFESGLNTKTYKFYIDFASRSGLEYIILDEGWYKLGDLMSVNPDINVEELVEYGKKKNVGIILWVVWKTLDDQLDQAMAQFERWGIKGIKVDFMQRDDQWMVNYYYKIAREAAKRQLLVDFHGAYKPTGMSREYPNVLTHEGVLGMEHSKWGANASPENALIIPFVRGVAGPFDYTPGAMMNAGEKDFKPVFNRPMSQGTRCQQLAMYVVYESPLQMLADNPSNYLRESDCMQFLSAVPSVWDETKGLDGKISDYVAIARRSGEDWYVGAMNDWTPRTVSLNFSFLAGGTWKADIYQDGANAAKNAIDYKHLQRDISAKDVLEIKLAGGGGWVARITKTK
jgi:alpha-glucosidase